MAKKKAVKMKKFFTEEELDYIFRTPEIESDEMAFIPIFAMTIATYPTFYKKIDELYEKKPFEYHLALKQSVYKHFYRFDSLSLEEEFYAKRTLALFEYDLKHKEGFNTFHLFNIAKNRYYHQVKVIDKAEVYNQELLGYELYYIEGEVNPNTTHYNKISAVEDVRSLFAKKHSMYAFLLDERLKYDLMMLFLARCMQKEIDFRDTEVIQKGKLSTMSEGSVMEAYMEATVLQKEEAEGTDFFDTVKSMVGKANLEDEDVREIEEAFGYKDITILENTNISSYILFSLLRYIEYMENYTLPSVQLPSNKKEAEKEVAQILASAPYEPNQTLEKYYYVYFGLFFKRIIGEFKKTKEFFYEKETNEQSLELKRLKQELKDEREKTEALEKKVQEQEKTINEKQKKDQAEWNILHQENKKLYSQVESLETRLENQTEELHYLREYSYELEQEFNDAIVEKPVDNVENFLKVVNESKIVVVGGHQNWKPKLKERIPALIFIDRDTRFDATILQTADFVYYQIDNLSHGVFYRTHPIIKKAKVPFGFIPSGNIDITILQMQHEWEKKRKQQGENS